ncbi:putative glutathione S-transferase [Cladophialophora carrionii]|uniref:Putative glutathione S-transferase n=1 Tax=Cladophialophora carrionii TaxID=86049 RepID=A0A1C1CT31_9EURO|nr:putative glutathione S-transferase [Cladophialophora carrionii]
MSQPSPPPPPLTVHHLHISQSERIVFLCEELQIPYTLKTYTRAPIFAPPDLAALTPQRSAPVITTTNPVTGVEFNMSESGAIAEYVNTVYGGGKLAVNPDQANYPDYVFWFHYATASLGPSFFRKMMSLATDPTGAGTTSQSYYSRSVVMAGIHKHLAAVEARLASAAATTTTTYLAGDEFTLADVMTVWSLTTGRQWYQVDLSAYPAVLAYLDRVAQRDRYQRAMAKAEPGLDWRRGITADGPDLFGPYRDMLVKMGVDVEKSKG